MISRFFAAEFPNDNSDLHLGTIWMSEEPCGPVEPHFPEDEPIEIVDSIELEGPVEVVPVPVAVDDDAFVAFLRTLSDAAAATGASLPPAAIGAALAVDAVARSWAAILRCESEDFSLCATTLDEWASATLARLLGAPHKAAELRRELRSRGVAAFGLVEAA